VDQPFGLLTVGMALIEYERAFEEVAEADRANPPRSADPNALKLVMETTAAALLGKV
jgi:hypothetical protein